MTGEESGGTARGDGSGGIQRSEATEPVQEGEALWIILARLRKRKIDLMFRYEYILADFRNSRKARTIVVDNEINLERMRSNCAKISEDQTIAEQDVVEEKEKAKKRMDEDVKLAKETFEQVKENIEQGLEGKKNNITQAAAEVLQLAGARIAELKATRERYLKEADDDADAFFNLFKSRMDLEHAALEAEIEVIESAAQNQWRSIVTSTDNTRRAGVTESEQN